MERRRVILYYLPVLEDGKFSEYQKLASKLRSEGKNVLLSTTKKKLTKAMKYCDKNHIKNMVIYGEDEMKKGEYIVKDLESGEETNYVI